MTILDELEAFSFTIIPGAVSVVSDVIKAQGPDWGGHEYRTDMACLRDVRMVCLSLDGPKNMAAVHRGILLSEVYNRDRPITLFVSSVNDGYVSMVNAISKKIPGLAIMFRIYRMEGEDFACFIQSFLSGESRRTVYVTRDHNDRWDFFEQGELLDFEEPENYLARRKRDRLNPGIISRYLGSLGYVSLDRSLWINDHEQARLLAHSEFRIWHKPEPTHH